MKALCFYAMMVSLACAIYAFNNPVKADESIVFGGWSSHYGETWYVDGEPKDYNENNYTFGYGINDYYVAVSKLSYYNWGVMVYYDWVLEEWEHTTISVRVGVVYGYHNSPKDIMFFPMFVPTITQRLHNELYFQAGVLGDDNNIVATGNLLWRF